MAEGSFSVIRPDEQDYFAFDFNNEVGPVCNFTGSITGDTLTVTAVAPGSTIRKGYVLTNQTGTIMPGTYITDMDTSVGGIGTYKVNQPQTVTSTPISGSAYVIEAEWSCTAPLSGDPTPQARLLSEPTIARNVTSVLIGTMIDGVSYLLTATATLSDGRVLVSSATVSCVLTLSPDDDILTVAEFRTIYPAFSDAAMFSDATIAYWIHQATTMPVIDPIRWGQFYNFGISLWVAHILTIGNAQRAAMKSGSGGIGSGVPASKSVNGVSISYDTQFGVETNAGWYGLTPYGNAFLRYLRMAGAGPIQVGTGYWWNPPGTVINVGPIGGGRPIISRFRPW